MGRHVAHSRRTDLPGRGGAGRTGDGRTEEFAHSRVRSRGACAERPRCSRRETPHRREPHSTPPGCLRPPLRRRAPCSRNSGRRAASRPVPCGDVLHSGLSEAEGPEGVRRRRPRPRGSFDSRGSGRRRAAASGARLLHPCARPCHRKIRRHPSSAHARNYSAGGNGCLSCHSRAIF